MEKEIMNGNVLIAEFLGFKKELFYQCKEGDVWEDRKYGFKDLPFDGGQPLAARDYMWFPQTELNFHSDWNWLMYAWFKFQQKLNNTNGTTLDCSKMKGYLSSLQQTFCMGICEDESILTCFSALIEGINWYNKVNVLICTNCKEYWIAPKEECICGCKTLTETHTLNANIAKNKTQ
jgi:hypothetical protein